MSNELQHCPACQEEYVAGVAACVECGGALEPGPLDRSGGRKRGAGGATATGAPRPDRLLAELPGLDADLTARALLRENISCRVECQGAEKVYTPDRPPEQPFAVSLPVTLYVSETQLEAAQDILASLQHEDVIGEQWSEGESEEAGDRDTDDEVDVPVRLHDDDATEPDPESSGEPAPESTSFRTIILIVLAVVVLLFVFGR